MSHYTSMIKATKSGQLCFPKGFTYDAAINRMRNITGKCEAYQVQFNWESTV